MMQDERRMMGISTGQTEPEAKTKVVLMLYFLYNLLFTSMLLPCLLQGFGSKPTPYPPPINVLVYFAVFMFC
jgi:hypothetical protein